MNNPFRSYEDTQSVFDVIKKEFFPMTEAEKLSQEMLSDDIVARLREAAMSARTTERVICDEAADEIERLRRERDEATRYAENLAVALSRHFPHVPQWKPLTGDLIGLLTQIDNMAAGLSPARAVLEEERE